MENFPSRLNNKYWKELYQQTLAELRSDFGVKYDGIKLVIPESNFENRHFKSKNGLFAIF